MINNDDDEALEDVALTMVVRRRLQVNALLAFIARLDDDARRVLGQFINDEVRTPGVCTYFATARGTFIDHVVQSGGLWLCTDDDQLPLLRVTRDHDHQAVVGAAPWLAEVLRDPVDREVVLHTLHRSTTLGRFTTEG